jgi:hypothetical protein
MSKPFLDRSDWNSCGFPSAGAGLSKAMQKEMFADWIGPACHLNRAFAVIPAFVDHGRAFAAVKTGLESNPFQLLKKVTVRLAVFVYKNPPAVRRVVLTAFEQDYEACRYRNCSFLMILGDEADILLLADVKFHAFEINVSPCRVLNFLLAASRSKKELISNSILVGHDREQLF